jgi:hypothetical protein
MSRRSSHTPDISAIERRAMERVERLRAEVFAESAESAERRKLAWPSSSRDAAEIPRFRRSERAIVESSSLFVQREPCVLCGVRGDLHANFGCGKWRPLR